MKRPAAAPVGPPSSNYFYGFCPNAKKAFRCPPDEQTKRDYSTDYQACRPFDWVFFAAAGVRKHPSSLIGYGFCRMQ